ncbi:MAG: TRAP transporter large permease [Desulfobacterales bacterium]
MWVVLFIFVILLISGTAFAYLMGAVATLSFYFAGKLPYLQIVPQRIFSQLDVFALMAMPLFILTAEIMGRAGVTRALIDFAMSIVGRFKGGLGHVNIMTSIFFAGISGSALADSAALSRTFVPEMIERGYPPKYAAAVTAGSSMIGPIIPPSIIMIIYGGLIGTSVAALFVAGIIPGILLAIALFILNGWMAVRQNHPGGRTTDVVPAFFPSLLRAAPAILLPFIILGSLVFGVATPTEGAAVAVLVALIVSALYRKLTLRMVIEAMEATAAYTGTIFIILCAISVLGYLAGLLGWPSLLASWLENLGLTGTKYLLCLVFVFLIAGMFMDTPVALTLLIPLLAPTALEQGINPVHLGIVLCFNLCVGLITPPLGKCLVVVAAIVGINYWRLAFAILPFILVQIVVLFILALFPDISLFLPRILGFKII